MEMDFYRQLDIINPENLKKYSILIVGSGGAGSVTAFTLSKIGFSRIKVVDDDIVEIHNLPNQFFRLNQLSRNKVEAVAENIRDFTGFRIETCRKKIKNCGDIDSLLSTDSSNIVISTTDNMDSRKIIFESCKFNAKTPYLIDCRVTYPFLLIFKVDTSDISDIEKYQKNLFKDSEGEAGSCTARSTFYTSLQSAVFIALACQSVVQNKRFPFLTKFCFNPVQLVLEH